MRLLFFSAIFCFLGSSSVQSQENLSLEKLYGSDAFNTASFGPARWMPDGKGYTILEDVEGGNQIVFYPCAGGESEVLVSVEQLTVSGASDPLKVSNYSWSPSGDALLIFTNTKRVWRTHTRGDYWVLDLGTYKLTQLGKDLPPSSLMFATFSPDGEKFCYVSQNNLYVEHRRGGSRRQLTRDGSETVINGTFDWVYEEEFQLTRGFEWSPDSRSIAYWQLDAEGVGVFNLIDNTGGVYSRVVPVQYPKVGTTNSACRVGVVGVNGGKTRWMKLEGDSRNHYIAQMSWAGNSKEIMFQRLNRLQNRNSLLLGDGKTGKVSMVLEEEDKAWLEVVSEFQMLDGGASFLWVSERDGWRHVYKVVRSGKKMTLLTPGSFDVMDIVKVDEEGGWLYYRASLNHNGQRYLYRSPLNGVGERQRLTPEKPGMHEYDMSPDAKWAFHTHSSFETPPEIDLIHLPHHKREKRLVGNDALKERLGKLSRPSVEFFQVGIDEDLELDAWMLKPGDFDPAKKYPALFFVYGEPWNQTVLDGWSKRNLWHAMLAQQGYLVISVDNRGTPAPRGRAFRKAVYGQIGILASQDQAAALKTILKTRPYVDSNRIGIWGWSGGGSMTLNMLFRYPDLYHTGMSVAPVGDQRLYDTIYQERYMGLPETNPDGYKNGSPVTFAHQLRGNLLLVHGTGDDNVHYQNAEIIINELIRNNLPFTMMAYPNRSHGIFEGKNTTRHLFELLTRYLHENLPVGPR